MPENREAARIAHHARKLLDSGKTGGFTIRRSAHVEHPIPVLGPTGELSSWFVPITVGDILAGFFEFLPDLTLIRYSSFQRRENSLDGCPAAASWIDSGAIRHRIETAKRPGETIEKLFLSYDKSPTRIAWAAILRAPDGTTRTVYASGQAVWEADSGIDSIGSN